MKKLSCIKTALALAVLLSASGCGKEESAMSGGEKVDVAAQLAIVKSGEDNAKVDALVEIGKAGERAADAVPALIETLKSKDETVRRMAAYALGQIGPKAKAAVPALQALMNDPVREVPLQAVNSLRQIDPASAPKLDMGGGQ